MLRLVGILTGSALTLAVMVVIIGMPRLTERAAATGSPVEYEEPPVAFEPDFQPEPEPDPVPETVETELVNTSEIPNAAQEVPEPESRWYAFWSPFRSEIAADGFVSELQRTTGLDYRIVKLKPGVYEVAFAFTDDADREQKLSRIAAATGLDMSGG